MSERRSDVEDVDEIEYVLGGDNRGESEVERICRVLLVCKLDERIEPLRTLGEEIVDAGLGGEDVTAEDVDALRKAMTELEYVLQDYAEPLVDEDELSRDRLNPVRDDQHPHEFMNSTSEDTNTDVRVETLYTNAYVAVGQLADAIGPNTYRSRDVVNAKERLRTGLEKTPDETDVDAVDRVESALERLSDLEPLSLGERRMRVRDALADLAPVGAGLSDAGRLERAEGDGADVITSRPGPNARGPAPAEERPTVPVFYSIPQRAADRAIERFNQRSEQVTAPEQECLTDYVLDEIEQQLVLRVGGEPLAEYAAGQLEDVTTEAGDE